MGFIFVALIVLLFLLVQMRNWTLWNYKFKHWLFRWEVEIADEAGPTHIQSPTFTVAGFLRFVKYKEHTMIVFGKKEWFADAPKYIGKEIETISN